MPTNLTPQEQLTAAQNQFNNWLNQQQASGNTITLGDYNAQKAAILNSGAYPALSVGYQPAPPAPGGGLTVTIANDQFFIVGQGGNYVEDNTSGYSGTPLLSNDGLVVTADNAEQVAAAQQAAVAAQAAASQAATAQSAQQASDAQSALAAAQARVAALQAQANNTQASDTTPTSSADAQAASSAINQQQGQEISNITDANAASAASISQQNASASARQQAELAQTQAQITATNTNNTAQSSGSGTANSELNTAITNNGVTQTTPSDAIPVNPNQTVNSVTNGTTEDAAGVAVQTQNNNTTYTDQQPTGGVTNSQGVPAPLSSYNNTGNQPTSNITSSGPASINQNSAGNNSSGSGAQSHPSTNIQRPNKLHNYVNYTYRISIYGIPRETINQIYSQAISPGNEHNLMNGGIFVASDSGMSAQTANRTFFPTDLTIDNLELQTIVNSTGDQTRATDVIKLKFDIIEPYTVSFLARLQKLATALNPGDTNFSWSNSFFVMKIEFMGYNDNGQPIAPSIGSNGNGEVIPGTTKYIPFTFVGMKFKITSSGGTYSCEAIPSNGMGISSLDNQIPFHIETKGGSIADLFNGTLASTTTTSTLVRPNSADQELQTTTTQNTVSGNQTTVTKGIADALNAGEIEKANQVGADGKKVGQWLANEYEFEFHNELLSAKVIDPQTFKDQSVAISGASDANNKKQGQTGSLTITTNSQAFRATAGTRITDFIGSVITVSDYMTGQNTTSGQDNQPVKTWKITPVIKFGSIDRGTGYYQRTTKYVIMPYTMYGHDAPGFGQAPVSPNQIVKTYTYLYSGQNKDVIEANINYNMAFFEFRNGVPANYINKANDESGNEKQQSYTSGGYDAYGDGRFFKPRYHYVRGLADRQNTGPTTVSAQTIAVQELMEKLMDNRGDMVQLDFTIVGDPDWISQDYALMHPSVVGTSPYIGSNGSINYTNPVYFNFYFATPNTDYDDTSGLFNVSGAYSEFSGIYRTIQVTSTFSGGKFTQKLKNYRVRNQQPPASTAARSDNVPSQSVNAATRGATENPVAEAATNTVGAVTTPTSSQPSTSNNTSTSSEDAGNELAPYTYATGS